MSVITDPIAERPTITGQHSRVWRADLDTLRRVIGEHHFVEAWIIEAAWAHPVWHSYMLMLYHLRPIEGVPAPIVILPGATHEFTLAALDPRMSREPAIAGTALPSLLRPVNFTAQIIAADDEAARDRLRPVLQDIAEGRLSPDTDFRGDWVARFGDHMLIPSQVH